MAADYCAGSSCDASVDTGISMVIFTNYGIHRVDTRSRQCYFLKEKLPSLNYSRAFAKRRGDTLQIVSNRRKRKRKNNETG